MSQELIKKVQLLFKNKKFSEIINLYKLDKKEFENNLFLLEGICLACLNLEKKTESADFARKILSVKNDHIGANHVLAKALIDENIDESIVYYRKVIALSNKSVKYLTEYAGLLFFIGVYEEPIKIFKDLVKKSPQNLSFKISLSKIYIANHDYDLAINILNDILKFNNQQINIYEILNLLGTAYHNDGNYKLAKENYKKSIDIQNKNIEPYINLAVLEQEYGNFDDARVILDQVNKLKKNAESYRLISSSKKFKNENDADLLDMLILNSSSNLQDKDKTALHFAIGKAYEDIGHYKESAKFYQTGNQFRRKEFKKYNFPQEIKILKELKEIYDENYFNKFRNINNLGEGMIFIVGMPRSGTTLLEQVLSSHHELYGAGELNFFTQGMDEIFQTFHFQNFKKKIFKLKKKEVSDLGRFYISKIENKIKPKINKKFIIDKNPLNFKNIPLIFASLPKAKVIHIQRNQNDNCLSIYKNFFYHNVMPWSYSQDELKMYYNEYSNFMFNFKNKVPEFIYEIKYEEMISDLENQIKKVLNYIGLNWDQECLNFKKNKRSVRTASINQVRQGVYQTSKNSWKNYKEHFKDLFI